MVENVNRAQGLALFLAEFHWTVDRWNAMHASDWMSAITCPMLVPFRLVRMAQFAFERKSHTCVFRIGADWKMFGYPIPRQLEFVGQGPSADDAARNAILSLLEYAYSRAFPQV